MIDLTPQITLAQISFFLAVIAVAAVYYVFGKKSPHSKK